MILFLRLLQTTKRLLPCLLALLPLFSMACNLFYVPSPPKTPEPVPVNSGALLIDAANLPELKSGRAWVAEIRANWDRWDYANPIDVVSATFYEDGPSNIYVLQTIIQLQDVVEGWRLWDYLKDHAASPGNVEYIEGDVALLSLNELSPLHADQVALTCEDYGSRLGIYCAVRLQYEMFVVEIMAEIDRDNVTPEMFYEILDVADEAMRPIWEHWPTPTPISPIGTPITEPFVRIPTTPIQRWRTLPLAPPGSHLLNEIDNTVSVDIPLEIKKTEKFYLDTLRNEGWRLVEQLWTPNNQYDGQSFFLHFWRVKLQGKMTNETACIHGLTEEHIEGTYVIIGECEGVRRSAEGAMTQPWEKPTSVEWLRWLDERLSISYPADWQEDPEFLEQPYCQPQSDVECIVGFVQNKHGGVARLSIRVQEGPVDIPDFELMEAEQQAIMQADPSLLPVTSMFIRLDDGSSADQYVMLPAAQNTPSLSFTVHTFTDTEHFIVTGTIAGRLDQVFANYPTMMAMVRSLQIPENSDNFWLR